MCLETAPKVQQECEVSNESLVLYGKYLQEVLLIIEGALGEFLSLILH